MGKVKVLIVIVHVTLGFFLSYGLDSFNFLNENYLPSTLVLESSLVESELNLTNKEKDSSKADGDIGDALNTMTFHRKMINEYLCRNFIAKEIVEEFEIQGHIASDRLGMAAKKDTKDKKEAEESEWQNNGLLEDIGSEAYKKWLARSTILNDIYRHYDQSTEEDSSRQHQLYANGEVTGYAIEEEAEKTTARHPIGSAATTIHNHLHHHPNHLSNLQYGGHAYNGGHSVPEHTHQPTDHGFYNFGNGHASAGFDYAGTENYYNHHQLHHHATGHEKGLALKDLFDLALTALAFLAFGMFILNIIMTCFAAQQGTTVVMQLNDTDGSLIRSKRGVDHERMDIRSIDQLSYYVLNSIDSLTDLYKDNKKQAVRMKREQCLRRSVCECNRFSRKLSYKQQLWVPVWSFGLSWISGKVTDYSSMLETLKAAVLGLGKADCRANYPTCSK